MQPAPSLQKRHLHKLFFSEFSGILKAWFPPGDNPDSIAKLAINQKLSPKWREHYFGINVKAIENYRPFQLFRNYRQFSRG